MAARDRIHLVSGTAAPTELFTGSNPWARGQAGLDQLYSTENERHLFHELTLLSTLP